MSIQEWEYKGLKVVVPDQKSLTAADELANKIDDDFMSAFIASKRGITITLDVLSIESDFPQKADIALSPEKARELANFLLDATENLI